MLVQVVDVLDDPALGGPAHGDVVEHRQVLHGLAQADPARVRAHPHAEPGREQQDRQVLVDARDPGGVDLQHLQGVGLEELLEHDAVGAVLAGRDRDRCHLAGDPGVAEHVVGAGGLLHPGQVEAGQLAHPRDGLLDLPPLVGVDGDPDVRPARRPGDAEAADVVGQVGPHLELDLLEPVRDGLAAQPVQLVVVVAEPARGGGVGGVAVGEQRALAGRTAGTGPLQQLQRLLARERVGEVAEVHEVDELLGVEPGQQLPQRQPLALGAQVPQRVDHGADRHVHDALLGAEPAQLGVVDQLAPEPAEVGQDGLDLAAEEVPAQRLDRGHLHVVAPADREHEAVALEAVVGVGAQPDVGGGVVGVGVHGVRPVERRRRGEPDVVGAQGGEARHDGLSVGVAGQ